ncbi:helix-turn-helix domain-containing protein [Actinokineospora sp. NPDC004072]
MTDQLSLPADPVRQGFDPARLTQARHLAAVTKKDLADQVGVTAAAISQYELGAHRPRPDHVEKLARALRVPVAFFRAGRPHGRLDASMAHFRSLRATRVAQRCKAAALVEQVWELCHALEKRVDLPVVDLPGFADGDISAAFPRDPVEAARALRAHWGLGTGPVSHLVRRMEAHGIIVVWPPPDPDSASVDAFSTSKLHRPIVVLTTNRADDVHRYRFTAAHELGHLILHHDIASGDARQEKQADAFAAEFLTPRDAILPRLPARVDLRELVELQREWGVSVQSLVYRCRETGRISDAAAARAYQRLNALRGEPGFRPEPVTDYPGEQPALLRAAFDLATRTSGLTLPALADELAWHRPRVRELLGIDAQRPALRLLP